MTRDLTDLIKHNLAIDLPLERDTPLLSSGIVDSFQVVQLLALLERHYQVLIDPKEIGVDNFDTIDQISRYVESQR